MVEKRITIENCRRILKRKKDYTDQQIRQIRDWLYVLSESIISQILRDKKPIDNKCM